jgi:hypothetical protein
MERAPSPRMVAALFECVDLLMLPGSLWRRGIDSGLPVGSCFRQLLAAYLSGHGSMINGNALS